MKNQSSNFADVILPLPLAGTFTYEIPSELGDSLVPGMRVIVQFGTRKFYSALVHKIHKNRPEGYEIKSIESLIDQTPIIPSSNFVFWEWIAGYYHCTLGEVLKAALPSCLKLESETRINFNPHFTPASETSLSPRELLMLEVIEKKSSLTITELNNSVVRKNALVIINDLLRKGAITVEEEVRENYKEKTESVVVLSERINNERLMLIALDSLKKVPLQQQLFTLYLEKSGIAYGNPPKKISKKALLEYSGCSAAVLSGLVKKQLLRIEDSRVDRIITEPFNKKDVSTLSQAQQIAHDQILEIFTKKPVALLYGVTSSGKTEIYINLIRKYLDQGKQVLYLLPEIALTTQIIHRLKEVFGDLAGIYHSKFNDSERVEIWNKVREHNHQDQISLGHRLIVGTRSALFLPFSDLGLIIVDEEHENSFKQYDPAPRYHARDAAVVLGHFCQSPVLLGTATPSVETFYNACTGKYGLVTLKERHKKIEMPEILIADFKDAYKRKQMRAQLTPLLYREISGALERKEQIILFQNRRGYSPYIECKLCGWVPKCIHCDVSLTHHKHTNSLICHYCGYTKSYPTKCSNCSNAELTNKGFGTEKAEHDIQEIFPEARVERMDLDTTRSKHGFEKIIQRFQTGQIDILIGTQMVTKGLDFENVSVVGILNADNLLNQPDFRAYERGYQLMAQVSGRAGRKHKRGKVVIQTTSPDHPIIQYVVANDYEAMYESQLSERKQFNYPPFFRMIGITTKHRDKSELDRITAQIAFHLKERFGRRVLGPDYPVVNRIKLQYLKQMWIKMEREASVVTAKQKMQEIIDKVRQIDGNKGIQIIIDVDPL